MTFGTGGRLYHYRLYDPDKRCFQGLSVYTVDLAAPSISDHKFASRACWAGGRWTLEDGWEREFGEGSGVGNFRRFERTESTALDPPDHFARGEVAWVSGGDLPDQMNLNLLGNQISSLDDMTSLSEW